MSGSAGDSGLVLYKATTLYFGTDKVNGFRAPGFSTERRLENGELGGRDQKRFGDGRPVIRGAGSCHKSTISS